MDKKEYSYSNPPEGFSPLQAHPGYHIHPDGRVFSEKLGRCLKASVNCGYWKVVIGRKHRLLHRLLATTFIPNPENKPFINHINGNRGDFSLSNLEWCTPGENIKHAYRTGLMPTPKGSWRSGIYHRGAKPVAQCDVSTGDVIAVYPSISDAVRQYNVGGTYKQLCYRVVSLRKVLTGERQTYKGFYWLRICRDDYTLMAGSPASRSRKEE